MLKNEDVSQRPTIEYFYVNPGRGDNTKTQIVREWFDYFNTTIKDKFLVARSTFQAKLIELLLEVEKTFGKTVMEPNLGDSLSLL